MPNMPAVGILSAMKRLLSILLICLVISSCDRKSQTEKWTNQESWQKLEKGMTDAQVEQARCIAGKFDHGYPGNKAQYFGSVEFVCRPSQFARFLIMRNEAGMKNGFKELYPKLIEAPKPIRSPIDVSTNDARRL